MLRIIYMFFLLSASSAVCAQDDVIDIRVVKNSGIYITPDTPYLIHAHKYQFIVRGTHPQDEVRVAVDKGKATANDTFIYIIPRYTLGDRHTEPDTITVTVKVKDKHQVDAGSCVKKYLVFSPLNKPIMGASNGSFVFWGDWLIGSYINWYGQDKKTTTQNVMANLNKEFTFSASTTLDPINGRFASVRLTTLTHYHQFYAVGDRLTPEMIKAITDEKNGCKFTIQLSRPGKPNYDILNFDTGKP